MSELVPRDCSELASPQGAELERGEDERGERRRFMRQVVLALVLAGLLAVRIVVVGY